MTSHKPSTNSADQLYEDRLKTEALLESIGDAVIVTDQEGRIRQANQIALKLLGYKEDEVIGQWFPRLLRAHNEAGQETGIIDRPITRAILSGKPVSEKMYYKTKDDKSLPVFVTVSPLLVGGRPIGAIEIFHDITVEHNIDKMKSEFISLASHQLRTPLSAIKTYSHLLADGFVGKLNPEQAELMETIMLSVDRMNELIDTLLDTSKIERGMLELRREALNVSDLFDEVKRELEPQAKHKKLIMAYDVEADLNIKSDPLLLREVFANLLSNAIKYTPEKGRVYVSLKQADNQLLFEVTDTGYGIPRRSQSRIFSKFFRASNAIEKETWGTGLGLYIVKSIADNLGARVWFTSKENSGSSFYFSLPLGKKLKIKL